MFSAATHLLQNGHQATASLRIGSLRNNSASYEMVATQPSPIQEPSCGLGLARDGQRRQRLHFRTPNLSFLTRCMPCRVLLQCSYSYRWANDTLWTIVGANLGRSSPALPVKGFQTDCKSFSPSPVVPSVFPVASCGDGCVDLLERFFMVAGANKTSFFFLFFSTPVVGRNTPRTCQPGAAGQPRVGGAIQGGPQSFAVGKFAPKSPRKVPISHFSCSFGRTVAIYYGPGRRGSSASRGRWCRADQPPTRMANDRCLISDRRKVAGGDEGFFFVIPSF